jgi:multisubunit Na+/H+ antiporter MnhG subunit
MTDAGTIELPLLLFQFFFMISGVVGGMRVVDDVQRWREARIAKTVDA